MFNNVFESVELIVLFPRFDLKITLQRQSTHIKDMSCLADRERIAA